MVPLQHQAKAAPVVPLQHQAKAAPVVPLQNPAIAAPAVRLLHQHRKMAQQQPKAAVRNLIQPSARLTATSSRTKMLQKGIFKVKSLSNKPQVDNLRSSVRQQTSTSTQVSVSTASARVKRISTTPSMACSSGGTVKTAPLPPKCAPVLVASSSLSQREQLRLERDFPRSRFRAMLQIEAVSRIHTKPQ